MRYWKNNNTPETPYFACIFISEKTGNLVGYAETDKLVLELAMKQEGFLGYEQAGNNDGNIFISYWKTKEDIQKWSENETHRLAKKQGIGKWYKRYLAQICKVEMSHEFVR